MPSLDLNQLQAPAAGHLERYFFFENQRLLQEARERMAKGLEPFPSTESFDQVPSAGRKAMNVVNS